MRRRSNVVLAALLLLLTAAPATLAAEASTAARTYIVTVQADADLDSTLAGLSGRLALAPTHVYRHALRGFAATLSANQVTALSSDPRVRTIVADGVVHATAQSLPTGIDRMEADISSSQSGSGSGASSGPAIAVIDTGIDIDHPDLNVAGGVNCSTGRSFDDGNGHGTHVAGTVGARDDSSGVVGVAPGVPLYAVRVLDNRGSGSWSAVICGIDWVTANAASKNIKVANMSLGGSGSQGSCTDGGMRQAICESTAAGVTYVVAAGNSNADFATYVPATFPEVLTVTAMADFDGQPGSGAAATCRSDVDDTQADFSNYHRRVDLSAPGTEIVSTFPGGAYVAWSGTSMAAPFVSGTAALIHDQRSDPTLGELRGALTGETAPIAPAGAAWDGKLGSGRLDIGASVGCDD